MAHPQQHDFIRSVKARFPNSFACTKVLEVGSLDINGSVRKFFIGCDYLGIDVGAGPSVDLVIPGDKFDAPDDTFNVTVSCECFEHNPQWVETFQNMIRMTKPGGLVIMTCAAPGRPEHGTSRCEPTSSPLTIKLGWEYYLNLSEDDFRRHFACDKIFSSHEFSTNFQACDLYFWGIKK
jgi:SAM-dependent methyltransferase